MRDGLHLFVWCWLPKGRCPRLRWSLGCMVCHMYCGVHTCTVMRVGARVQRGCKPVSRRSWQVAACLGMCLGADGLFIPWAAPSSLFMCSPCSAYRECACNV